MYAKHIATGLVAATLLGTTAFAQTPATTAPGTSSATISSPSSTSFQGNWRSSKVIGLNVYNDGNESLGSINDLLTDKQGKIVAVVIGVGGFLGVGERYAAIPFEKVKFVNEPVTPSMANNSANNSAMPGTRPAPSTTTTTGAATGAVAPGTTTTTAPAAAPISAATPNPWYPDHAVVSATKDELKAMAEFKYTN